MFFWTGSLKVHDVHPIVTERVMCMNELTPVAGRSLLENSDLLTFFYFINQAPLELS